VRSVGANIIYHQRASHGLHANLPLCNWEFPQHSNDSHLISAMQMMKEQGEEANGFPYDSIRQLVKVGKIGHPSGTLRRIVGSLALLRSSKIASFWF
jgi:hypothetical protein